eukprot:scpid70736/ scgid21933/ 
MLQSNIGCCTEWRGVMAVHAGHCRFIHFTIEPPFSYSKQPLTCFQRWVSIHCSKTETYQKNDSGLPRILHDGRQSLGLRSWKSRTTDGLLHALECTYHGTMWDSTTTNPCHEIN